MAGHPVVGVRGVHLAAQHLDGDPAAGREGVEPGEQAGLDARRRGLRREILALRRQHGVPAAPEPGVGDAIEIAVVVEDARRRDAEPRRHVVQPHRRPAPLLGQRDRLLDDGLAEVGPARHTATGPRLRRTRHARLRFPGNVSGSHCSVPEST